MCTKQRQLHPKDSALGRVNFWVFGAQTRVRGPNARQRAPGDRGEIRAGVGSACETIRKTGGSRLDRISLGSPFAAGSRIGNFPPAPRCQGAELHGPFRGVPLSSR